MLSKNCQIKDIVQNIPPLCNMRSKIVQNAVYLFVQYVVPSTIQKAIYHTSEFFCKALKKRTILGGKKKQKTKAHIKVVLKLMFEEKFNSSMGLCCVETNHRKHKFIYIYIYIFTS